VRVARLVLVLTALITAVAVFGSVVTMAAAADRAGAVTAQKKKKKKKARCVKRASVNGKRVCLRLNAKCDKRFRRDYLRVKLDCVKRGRKRVIKRATPAALRQGRLLALPSSGQPTFAQAKDLFDRVVADLPGVNPKKGAIGRTGSGTSTLMWLYHYRSRLRADQRAVLDEVTRPDLFVGTVNVDPATGTVLPPPAAASKPLAPRAKAAQGNDQLVADFTAIIRDAIPRLQAKGVLVRHPVTVSIEGASPPGGDVANAWPQWLTGQGNACKINLFDPAKAAGLPYRRQVILHELTHCAQFEFLGGSMRAMPQWVSDGTAEYVAYNLIQEWIGTVPDPNWWSAWLRTSSDLDLFTHTYDAVGFWSLLAQKGANVYSLIGPVVAAGGSGAAYARATAGVDGSFRDDWGTSLAKTPQFGARWNLVGAGAPSNLPIIGLPVTADGPPLIRRVQRRGGESFLIQPRNADILQINGGEGTRGAVRAGDGLNRTLTEEMTFCMRPQGCECPGDPERFQKLPKSNLLIGFANDQGAGQVQVTAETFEKKCKKEKAKDDGEDGKGKGGAGGINLDLLTGAENAPRRVGRISSGSCGFSGKTFTARGSGSGFRFSLRIARARGPGSYTVPYSSGATFIKVSGSGTFSTTFGGRGPAGGSVVIKRIRVGKRIRHRISVGFTPLVNSSSSRALTLTPGPGGLVC